MIVVIQAILAEVRHVNIWPSVVVIVTHRHSKSPPLIRYTGFSRYIRECSIVVVVQQHRARWLFFTFQGSDRRTIQKINIQPTIIVIIE